ncbi:MAG: hypothetical protein EOP11_00190 [Proteobacteria bacterium]|nr:MAG: hypothetical protein EOP11_00190 [Pseudomonadota bacterium]
MLNLIALATLLIAVPALAESSTACAKFLPCATYSHEGTSDEVGPIARKISFLEVGPMQVELKFSRTRDGVEFYANSLRLDFQENGTFVGSENGIPKAIGLCKGNVCTMSAGPLATPRGVLTQVATFSFAPKNLTMHKLNIAADHSTNLLQAEFARE